MSRSQEAVRLVREEGLSIAEACRRTGITRSAYYQRLDLEKSKEVCPHCGQIIPEGHQMPKR